MFDKIYTWMKEHWGYDKFLHMTVGFIIMILFRIFFPSIWTIGIPTAIIIGTFKELYDLYLAKKHQADWWDLIATTIGALIYLIPMIGCSC